MNRLYLTVVLLFLSLNMVKAQQYEFGLSVGGTNMIGDIGNEYYFNHNQIGGGFVFKSVINPWMSTRFGLNYLPFKIDDAESLSLGRRLRDLSAEGTVLELSIGIEYNFWPRNPYIKQKKGQRLTPYLFSGVSLGAFYGTLTKNNNFFKDYDGLAVGVPMILGFKYRIGTNVLVAFETGARYTFTDNLDGTGFVYEGINVIDKDSYLPSTNTNSNDWYTFSSVSLIYTFGDLICYFNIF
jgi:hypothetical protein